MIKMFQPIALMVMILMTVSLFAQTKTPVEGFAGLKWGISITEARKGLKGKVVFDDEKRMIVTRDGEITYRYGFFFKKKEVGDQEQLKTVPADAAEADKPEPAADAAKKEIPPAVSADDETEGETKLFYVVSEFPYIALEDIRKKMTDQYGDSTGDTMTRSQGAVLWDTGNGVAIIWVDAYEKKPYCRKITYMSKTIAKELNKYQTTVFNKRELEVIKKLIP